MVPCAVAASVSSEEEVDLWTPTKLADFNEWARIGFGRSADAKSC
jgi:hypothetical protein